jgi:hypothetical protein
LSLPAFFCAAPEGEDNVALAQTHAGLGYAPHGSPGMLGSGEHALAHCALGQRNQPLACAADPDLYSIAHAADHHSQFYTGPTDGDAGSNACAAHADICSQAKLYSSAARRDLCASADQAPGGAGRDSAHRIEYLCGWVPAGIVGTG